jgi:hypothetical protein
VSPTIDITQNVFLAHVALYQFTRPVFAPPGPAQGPLLYQHCIGTDENLEPTSKVTVESALHPLKQRAQRSSTDDGMQIDESDEQDKNA